MGRLKTPEYAELHARSAFSLLSAASTPEQLAARAAELGLRTLALTDLHDLGGAVRFATACREHGVRPILGAEISVTGQAPLTLLSRDLRGWQNLAQLITHARLSSPRGLPEVSLDMLNRHRHELVCLSGGREGLWGTLAKSLDPRSPPKVLTRLRDIFDGRFYIEVNDHQLAIDVSRIRASVGMAKRLEIPWVVTSDVRHATPAEKLIYDTMTCLRHRTTLEEAGDRLFPNDARTLHSPESMHRAWRELPMGLWRTLEIAESCTFDLLDDLKPQLPDFPIPDDFRNSTEYLATKVHEGLQRRYSPLRETHRRQARHELRLIRKLGLSGYFLIVWDIVRFAQSRGILVQGRGSAANSVVCYALGITSVDPVGMELLFERFLSEGRGEAPDIDIDIAHRDREDVLQYVYERYGREHAAMVCETICWRGKSAVRDAARALGLPTEVADKLARQAGSAVPTDESYAQRPSAADSLSQGGVERAGLDPSSPVMRAMVRLLRGLQDLPRHRSIHVGGFVLTRGLLSSVVPIERASMKDRTVIQWDKDDLDPLGLVKIDLLGLGMLTLLSDALGQVRSRHPQPSSLDLHSIPANDAATYEMIQRADTVGVFQIESRAQMNCLPRTRPERFYDLVVQVALIRPGPIQGEMVHPYIRRRRGEEDVSYPHPILKPLLQRTLGVPLFQEQGMKVAITAAGFSPAQADGLRRAMGFRRMNSHMQRLCVELLDGMQQRGIAPDIAERIVKQLSSFASYGFPESHAASFALLVYASAYLKRHYAPEFFCALLNAQPMGFYPIGTILQDARRHGVRTLPPDITRSRWDSTLEGNALRMGLRMIKGLGPRVQHPIEHALLSKATTSIEYFMHASGLDQGALLALARAGAFDSVTKGRRQAQWEILKYSRSPAGPFDLRPEEPSPRLPGLSLAEETALDYQHLGASAQRHLMELLRPQLSEAGVPDIATVKARPPGPVRVVGLVNSRQRPSTARGTIFISLEDETDMLNIIVWPRVYQAFREVILDHQLLWVDGVLERSQGTQNVIARQIRPAPSLAAATHTQSHDFR